MNKRIFRSFCLASLGVMLVSALLFLGILYPYFTNLLRSQLRAQTELAAQGVSHEGADFFTDLNSADYRITWIQSDGSVLYDSETESAQMDNHLQRTEIQDALADGMGESSRYSSTLMERSFYCAKLLPDGTILRLSVARSSAFQLLLGMLPSILLVLGIALLLSLFFAHRLSRVIVEPLNSLNLEDPLNNEGYDELSPLLRRIDAQQRQIRQQDASLRKAQREFEAVTTGMAEGIVLINREKTILSINPAAMKLFRTDASAVGACILSVNRSLELQELLQLAEKGRHAEKILEFEGGTYQFDASPVFSDGTLSGIILLMLDVTEKEQSEQMRREFTANVSHELKTPLHTISGCAELLAEGVVREADVPKFSRQIYTEAQRMIRLVEDIIHLSHLDEGAGDMQWEAVDLYALAAQTVQELTPMAQAARIELTLTGESATVPGIRQLLSGILHNLCDNAVKYNRAGGSVTVTVADLPDHAALTVADTGIGIPPEDQERIFERFYRVDKSHSREIGGTGLGLSIVKHAVRLHNAALSLSSIPERGTTITVRFPKNKK